MENLRICSEEMLKAYLHLHFTDFLKLLSENTIPR